MTPSTGQSFMTPNWKLDVQSQAKDKKHTKNRDKAKNNSTNIFLHVQYVTTTTTTENNITTETIFKIACAN